jgi:protein-ribulosamine 3-kinase
LLVPSAPGAFPPLTVPAKVLAAVEAALESRTGRPVSVRDAGAVGGGCINPSARLETTAGDAFFLKWNSSAPREMFSAEADGLAALAAAGALRIPEVVASGGTNTGEDPGWLLLEFVARGAPGLEYGQRLGEGLAHIHTLGAGHSGEDGGARAETQGPGEKAPDPGPRPFGWHRDNFIGSLPQENREVHHWSVFWRELRLEPQLRLARSRGYFSGSEGRTIDRVISAMEDLLPTDGTHGPALLHGDLWSGNYYPDSQGTPVLIDPAVYRGDGEVDLAMMELFGALPRGFREGYETLRLISPEYAAYRRDLYQLYYLLVHVNLFGGGYVGSSLSAARRVLSAT